MARNTGTTASLPRRPAKVPPAAIQGHAATIVAVLRGEEPLTLTEIAAETALSRPTVRGVVTELAEQGWLVETDAQPVSRGAGRPAARFRFAPRAGAVAGVDVGVHTVRVIVFDLVGDTIAETESGLDKGVSRDGRAAAVIATISDAISNISAPLLALGVGAPGVVDRDGRIVTSPPLPAWNDLPLGTLLSERFECHTIVANDAMAAAEAERFAGIARGVDDFVYLLAGHRITSAIVLGGRVHRGRTGIAGLVGEIDDLAWHHAPEKLAAKGDPAEIFAQAAAGKPAAARAVDEYLNDLATGLAAVVLTVDPELVVIGGGISRAESPFTGTLAEKIAARARIAAPRVAASTLGSRATAIGGAAAALSWVERSILGRS